MPEDMSDRMPEDMPDRMPEDLPDRMPEDMPDHMPEDMPDRMPNKMSEDMSDRMPEDLPVRKCINVMVGITRSKVITCHRRDFFSNRSRHTYDVFRSLMSLQQTEINQQLGFFNLTGEPAFGALAHANLGKSKIACLWGTIGGLCAVRPENHDLRLQWLKYLKVAHILSDQSWSYWTSSC